MDNTLYELLMRYVHHYGIQNENTLFNLKLIERLFLNIFSTLHKIYIRGS